MTKARASGLTTGMADGYIIVNNIIVLPLAMPVIPRIFIIYPHNL